MTTDTTPRPRVDLARIHPPRFRGGPRRVARALRPRVPTPAGAFEGAAAATGTTFRALGAAARVAIMPSFELRAIYPHDPETVWEVIADLDSTPAWYPNVTLIERATSEEPIVGEQLAEVRELLGMVPVQLPLRVTRAERCVALEVAAPLGPLEVHASYGLAPVEAPVPRTSRRSTPRSRTRPPGSTTALVLRCEVRGPLALRPLASAVAAALRLQERTTLDALARELDLRTGRET